MSTKELETQKAHRQYEKEEKQAHGSAQSG